MTVWKNIFLHYFSSKGNSKLYKKMCSEVRSGKYINYNNTITKIKFTESKGN
ncbi:MAG: hypothetical protein ACJAT4_001690 [Granulosicoccus sp.]|jgi:hypothetical protein